MQPFDIAPFALPNCPAGEVRFEQARDIRRVEAAFAGKAPRALRLSYLRRSWPEHRFDRAHRQDLRQPFFFGWSRVDDHFNTVWQEANTGIERRGASALVLSFQGLRSEIDSFPDSRAYDVTFRRALGLRLDAGPKARLRRIRIYTTSPPARTRLRVELDAGRRTPGRAIALGTYNAVIRSAEALAGATAEGNLITLGRAKERAFALTVDHMQPSHEYCHDDGQVSFSLDRDMFTISLAALKRQGPIWFAEKGIFITDVADPTRFGEYRSRIKADRTILQQVARKPEQTFDGALTGQPRAHATPFIIGCKHARQRFWITPFGDIVLRRPGADTRVVGSDTGRFRNDKAGRFRFGLHTWIVTGRSGGPAPLPAYTINLKRDALVLEQHCFAVPLTRRIGAGEPAGDETICAMARFRFTNTGDRRARAELPVSYAGNSNVDLIPSEPCDAVEAARGRILSHYKGRKVLRGLYDTDMVPRPRGDAAVFSKTLGPGQSCRLLLKVPLIELDSPDEVRALNALDFDRCRRRFRDFWLAEAARGAQLATPQPRLDALHRLHLPIIQISDVAMPGDPKLINTSVGTGVYGNFANESCMIVEELEQRGLTDETRRRLEVWLRYQSTVGMTGNFTDRDGVFYGAGGFECGEYYNQHHGWVLWALANHYLYTRDDEWLARVADSLIAAADWVFRQRRRTMVPLPHSRGWEYGFLPAGGLEDVGDFHYWLTTNALTWRGTDALARTLDQAGHPQAKRVLRESDAFRKDLIAGFETMRRHTPIARLRDGRWVPVYPSRLYLRGRDQGWIRETLEGSVYLLLSGLYKTDSKQAGWILDDYHDNRFLSPPYGYPPAGPPDEWFDRGGFSMQPNLLAALLPHLERDEPEIYIWMFFNALASCYREETGALIEHPMPVLGFSNDVPFKTSDQANAVTWLRYMFVYAPGDTLYIGRAVPRTWFGGGKAFGLRGVRTHFGQVSVEYRPDIAEGTIAATVDLALHHRPKRISLRLRHPANKPIRKVLINGKGTKAFRPGRGDIDLTDAIGRQRVEALYA
ncbi:MAG: hypothetical protein ACYS5V_03145 [Planctomycetota bacterium]|jgi:hypothetical protein